MKRKGYAVGIVVGKNVVAVTHRGLTLKQARKQKCWVRWCLPRPCNVESNEESIRGQIRQSNQVGPPKLRKEFVVALIQCGKFIAVVSRRMKLRKADKERRRAKRTMAHAAILAPGHAAIDALG